MAGEVATEHVLCRARAGEARGDRKNGCAQAISGGFLSRNGQAASAAGRCRRGWLGGGALDFVSVKNGSIDLNVAVAGEGPLIVCVHGFPELWYSWRHQIAHFSGLGYKVAALDVRGYGGSSKPSEIAAYSIRNLASDVAAVIDQLGGGTAILFGHDWGAPIVWNTALLYPGKVVAVAGLSVPFVPRGSASFIDTA